MADVVPYFQGHFPVTGRTSEAVTGGRFVAITGDLAGDVAGTMPEDGHPRVGHTAAVRPFGVAARDTISGETVSVFRTGFIVPVVAGGTVTAGEEVESDADGKAITLAAGVAGGLALSSGVLNETIMVQVY